MSPNSVYTWLVPGEPQRQAGPLSLPPLGCGVQTDSCSVRCTLEQRAWSSWWLCSALWTERGINLSLVRENKEAVEGGKEVGRRRRGEGKKGEGTMGGGHGCRQLSLGLLLATCSASRPELVSCSSPSGPHGNVEGLG